MNEMTLSILASLFAAGIIAAITRLLSTQKSNPSIYLITDFRPFRSFVIGETDIVTVLWIRFRNVGALPINILACGYKPRLFPPKLPIQKNASRNPELMNLMSIKFGEQWMYPSIGIKPGGEVESYIPMVGETRNSDVATGRRGKIIIKCTQGTEMGIFCHQI